MKGGLRKLSAPFKGRDKPGAEQKQQKDWAPSQKLQKSVSNVKRATTRRTSVKPFANIPDFELPSEMIDYQNNLKSLSQLFEELLKNSTLMLGAINSERDAGKHIAETLSDLATPISKTEASRALG